MSTRSGREFGKYTLVHRLAVGEVTEAYLCRLYGIEVVVRRLRPGVTDPVVVSSFLAEARLASALDHPNLVKVHEITEHEGIPFVVLEHVRGPNLARIVQATAQDPARSWGEMAMIFAAIARGVAYAHVVPTPQGEHLEIIHGGITLDNIVVSDEGSPKLYDFGLAHARGTTGLTPRDDLRALGRCLYHATTGHAPTSRPIHARELVADYPPMLDEIVWAALDPDDRRRFSGVDVLAAALEAFTALPNVAATTRPLAEFLDTLQLDFDEPVNFGSAHGYGGRTVPAAGVAPRATVSASAVAPAPAPRRNFALLAAGAVALGALVTALAAPRFAKTPPPQPASVPAAAPAPAPEITPQPLISNAADAALPAPRPTPTPTPVVATPAHTPPSRKPLPARPAPRPRPATTTVAAVAIPDAIPPPRPHADPPPAPSAPASAPASASVTSSPQPAPAPAVAATPAPAAPNPAPAPAAALPAARKLVSVPTPLRIPAIYFVSSEAELMKMLSLVEREAVSVGKLPATTVRGTTRGLVPLLTPRLLPGQALEIHPIAIYTLLVRSGLEGHPAGAIAAELRRQQAAGKL